tara:strand:+ start:15093 stop:15764 length:672 start_codon:yes stop_codon:yes gene_type:complete
MSGRGQRFSEAGYSDPKPLIQIKGKMMFEYSLDNFNNCNKFIFVINQNIEVNSKFQKFINNFKEDYEIVNHKEITNGQATSLYLAIKELDEEQGVFVSSCDVSFSKIDNIPKDKNIAFTIKPEMHHMENAEQYGWIENINNSYKVSCKKLPKTNNKIDIITGCFYFNSLKDFKLAYINMTNNKATVNNEYYLDNIFNFEPILSKTQTLRVENYNSFGSPEEIV